jgi:hypothetical protein
VELLREEMKRVLRFLRWRAAWWEGRWSRRRERVSAALRAGLEAYAARQAAATREIARRFKRAWDTSAAMAVRMAVEGEALLAEDMAAFDAASGGEVEEGVQPGVDEDGRGGIVDVVGAA